MVPMLAPETITALFVGAVGIVLAIIAVLALDLLWPPLLRREFTVELPIEKAWQHLARLEQWPSWARHIRQIKVEPPGELTATSQGSLHLKNGLKPRFKVTEFNPHRSWNWVGGCLWATVHYDHLCEQLT